MASSYSFEVYPIDRFKGRNVAVSRPKEVACFSFDENHNFFPDDRSLRFYYPSPLGADLCKGFEKFRQFDDLYDEHLDSLLQTIILLEQKCGEPVKADFITWRGMMTKIMTSPYEGSGFEMNAVKFQETIFIEENHSHKLRSRISQLHHRNAIPSTHSQEMMSFWGYKFETLSTLSSMWDQTSRENIEQREDQVVENYSQYCSVIRTEFDGTALLLGGEVDAVWDSKPQIPEEAVNWVELKTTAARDTERDQIKYEKKLLRFWAQSYLLGVPKVIVGLRDGQGVLKDIEELETHNIPRMVKRGGRAKWDANVCVNFSAEFLGWLKSTIVDSSVWRIRKDTHSNFIEIVRLPGTEADTILCQDFLKWRKTRLVPRDDLSRTSNPMYSKSPAAKEK